MNRAEHIARMRCTGDLVIPIIRDAYRRAAGSWNPLATAMSRFLARRTCDHQPLLRPYLMRLGYEVGGGTDLRAIARALAAAEIFNISTYQANLAFDGKLEVATQDDRAEQFACAMISRELAFAEIGELSSPQPIGSRLLRELSIVSDAIYRGQIVDLRELNVRCLTTHTDLQSLRRLYEQRCLHLGGFLTRWCFISGAILAGAAERIVETLGNVGMQMGVAGQMVNDIGDFVPVIPASHSKRYQQPFSDSLNGKITLPLLCALEAGDWIALDLAQTVAGGNDASSPVLQRLVDHLCAGGAFARARHCISSYARHCARAISMLPVSTARHYLHLSISTLTHNKYFTHLRLAGALPAAYMPCTGEHTKHAP